MNIEVTEDSFEFGSHDQFTFEKGTRSFTSTLSDLPGTRDIVLSYTPTDP